MLQSIPRRLLLRSVRYSIQLPVSRQYVLPLTRRNFAVTTRCPKDDPKKPISDFVASQTPPSNPETPPDRMPHQTEEDIASEKIFNEQPTSGNGLPPEGVPVEEVIKETPGAMENAPEVIKEEVEPVESRSEGLSGDSADQAASGKGGMPHVSEEKIAYERIMSGDEATGASNSSAGKETPASAVPIEEVIGDGEKPAIMEQSENDEEPPAGGQSLRHEIPDESAESTRKSILDLFGSETAPRKGSKQSTKTTDAAARENVNPLASEGLDKVELSAWESHRSPEPKHAVDTDPEPWATSQRGTWETEKPHSDESHSQLTQFQEFYKTLEPPKPPKKKKVLPYDLRLPEKEPNPSSPWDYFYPAAPPPESLTTALRQRYENQHPEARKKRLQKDVYDPYAAEKKLVRWPFLYNRDELVNLCINHMMRNGKKARAEKIMQDAFFLVMQQFPRQHPVAILAEAVDRNAPLTKNPKSGGKGILKPVALNERQRIRAGWLSMVKAAGKVTRETIKIPFSTRLAKEIIKTMEGRGAGVPNRHQVHLTSMQNKMNIQLPRKPAL